MRKPTMTGQRIADDFTETIQRYRGERFTGLIKVSTASAASPQPASGQNSQWIIFFLLGRIVWTQARIHALRRWKRSIALYNPSLLPKISQAGGIPFEAWNYSALAHLVKRQQYPRSQFSNIVESAIAEDLVDIFQVGTQHYQRSGYALTYEPIPQEIARLPFVMIQKEHAWREAQQEWTNWVQAGLGELSPDLAPAITDTESLRKWTSPQTFQTLTAFVNGQNTLRDLAIKIRQPITMLTKSILPYVSRELLAFTAVPDLVDNANHGFSPALLALTASTSAPSVPNASVPNASVPNASDDRRRQRNAKSLGPRIVYIDDSPADSRSMSAIVEGLGYRYTNIPDPIQALPMLLELKPKLIFLDLVMPIANGYEVCAQIRRISAFKKTPVIIVTSNDGIADRVRARLVGASGFLGKPIRPQKVATVLKKHLPDFEPNHPYQKTERQAEPQAGSVLYSR